MNLNFHEFRKIENLYTSFPPLCSSIYIWCIFSVWLGFFFFFLLLATCRIGAMVEETESDKWRERERETSNIFGFKRWVQVTPGVTL